MPKPYPAEFRRDVVAVARKHEAPLAQIAKNFGISEATLHNWLKKADIEDGVSPGLSEKETEFRSTAFVRTLKSHGLTGSMGPRRGMRRQRRHGIILCPAAKERAGPTTLDLTTGTAPGHRDLDRENLPPPAPPTLPRSSHADRV